MFLPLVRCHLHSKKLKENALSSLDHCPAHPSADALKLKDGQTKFVFLPTNTIALIQPVDQALLKSSKCIVPVSCLMELQF
jgi:hypothetical protein